MRGLRFSGLWLAACYAIFNIMIASADEAHIAVAAEIGEKDAPVSAMAARAPYILIFNGDGSFVAAHRNPAAESPRRAGPALANWLAGKYVGTFIAGNFGDRLVQALRDAGIRAIRAEGPASAAVSRYRK